MQTGILLMPCGESWQAVIDDMFLRDQIGQRKYGCALSTATPDDMLQHAYEEALDLAVYLKTEILKRKKDE